MQPSCELNNNKFYGNSHDDESCDINSVTENNNLDEFFQFVEKWRSNRIAGNKKIEDIFRNSSCKSFSLGISQFFFSLLSRKC